MAKMRPESLLLALGAAGSASAASLPAIIADNFFFKRAAADAPNGYAPAPVDCPSTRPAIRSASALSPAEQSWLQDRRKNIIKPLRDFLTRADISGFDAGAYIDANSKNSSRIPNIAIGVSGGGYRALMNGAGVLAAFDSRTDNSTAKGHLGGLLQSATYLSGLSGGGWLVGSLSLNNFTSVQAIVRSTPDKTGPLWQFQDSIFSGPAKGPMQPLSTVQYYGNLVSTVNSKEDAGFNTSITDLWSRSLSFQLIVAPEGGPSITWSSLQDDPDFTAANVPMPILVADGRAPGEKVLSVNTTVFEFNPWEMGSWDPTVSGFAPLRYVGSNFSNGALARSERCIRGFDNAAFVMGTSSSLFNQLLLNLGGNGTGGINVSSFLPAGISESILGVIQGFLGDLSSDDNDIADWTPNPFFGWNNGSNPGAQSRRLTLVDGGEDLQNIPLQPLIHPARAVDVVFAVDSSADTPAPGANWPNGTAMVATYERSLDGIANGTTFPPVPDENTFINLGLNTRPTFFGCDVKNFSSSAHIPPLVVYVPNAPYIAFSNVSTFTFSYNISQRNAIIDNGYLVATRGNSTQDEQWPTCVGCAIMSRVWSRNNDKVPDVCNQCFKRYCWDGTRNSTQPTPYEPTPLFATMDISSQKKNAAAAVAMPRALAVVGAVVAGFMVLL
ncbi:Lysophospholipase [Drechslerella dactyloides]|uniref:Lysophospholipase n=1 Tax=Drechslerella dactyloides TaxID=74499 RepID=A0AAD6IZP3_DREDA|nr:Lysophospholipase [Drechslerella dactyloides]